MVDVPVLPQPRLPDQVVVQLLAAVSDSTFPPGTRLPPENELAEWAGVSRLTLREGVKILRDKGVLRVEQGRGTFVNPPESWSALDPALAASRAALEGGTAQTAQQVTEARRIVEVAVAGLAAQRRTEADLARLRATVARMGDAHERDDVQGFSAADIDFHHEVMLAAGNPFLGALLQPVMALLQQVRVTTSVTGEMRVTAIAAHGEILDAIAAGQERRARESMSEHMAHTHRVIERVAAAGTARPVPGGDGDGQTSNASRPGPDRSR